MTTSGCVITRSFRRACSWMSNSEAVADDKRKSKSHRSYQTFIYFRREEEKRGEGWWNVCPSPPPLLTPTKRRRENWLHFHIEFIMGFNLLQPSSHETYLFRWPFAKVFLRVPQILLVHSTSKKRVICQSEGMRYFPLITTLEKEHPDKYSNLEALCCMFWVVKINWINTNRQGFFWGEGMGCAQNSHVPFSGWRYMYQKGFSWAEV